MVKAKICSIIIDVSERKRRGNQLFLHGRVIICNIVQSADDSSLAFLEISVGRILSRYPISFHQLQTHYCTANFNFPIQRDHCLQPAGIDGKTLHVKALREKSNQLNGFASITHSFNFERRTCILHLPCISLMDCSCIPNIAKKCKHIIFRMSESNR